MSEESIGPVYPIKLLDSYYILGAIEEVLDQWDRNTNKYVFPDELNLAGWTEIERLLKSERPGITSSMINYFIRKKCINIKFNGKRIKDVTILHDITSSEPNLDNLIIKLNRTKIDRLCNGLFKGIKKCEDELGISEEAVEAAKDL